MLQGLQPCSWTVIWISWLVIGPGLLPWFWLTFISLSAGLVAITSLLGSAGSGTVGLHLVSVGTAPLHHGCPWPPVPGPEEAAGPHSTLAVSSDLLEPWAGHHGDWPPWWSHRPCCPPDSQLCTQTTSPPTLPLWVSNGMGVSQTDVANTPCFTQETTGISPSAPFTPDSQERP